MGMDSTARDVWRFGRIRELADKLDSPHADKVYLAKEYTKADLRRDLLETLPPPPPVGAADFVGAAEFRRHTKRVRLSGGQEVFIAPEDLPAWRERYGDESVIA